LYKDRVDYGKGSDGAVLGGRDEYQKVWSPSSQNPVHDRGKRLPARADITRDSAVLLWVRGYVSLSTDSLRRHDVLVYIPSQPIPLEVL